MNIFSKLLVITLLLLPFGSAIAQENEEKIFDLVEVTPAFSGGDVARKKYLKENLSYPEIAKQKGIQGIVFIRFVVEKDGSHSNIKVIRGIGGGCDEEAVRLVDNMPKWKPGKLKMKIVRTNFNMPIKFVLPDENMPKEEENIIIDTLVNAKVESNDDEIFVFVEDVPQYPGGDEARNKFLGNNITYPEKARENNIQGTVFITFIVEKDGSISGVKVIRGIGGGCDEEALNAVKNMPKWKPGIQRGKAVRCQFNMPVRFILSDSGSKSKLSRKERRQKRRAERRARRERKTALHSNEINNQNP